MKKILIRFISVPLVLVLHFLSVIVTITLIFPILYYTISRKDMSDMKDEFKNLMERIVEYI